MLARKQLEDLSKCGHIHCANCSCAPICEGVEMESAQTALALVDMLKRLEWECNYTCKICNGNKHTGHKPDCELAALLKGLEGSE